MNPWAYYVMRVSPASEHERLEIVSDDGSLFVVGFMEVE